MASTLWIHCNLCYYLLYRKDRKFYQLTCLHVFCKNCMAHSNRGTTCPVCKRQGIKFVEICNSMDNKVKILYAPTPAKSIEVTSKSINFQLKQKQHLIDQLVATEDKLDKADKAEQVLRQKIYESQQKYCKVRGQRRSMQDALRQQADSSPEQTLEAQSDRRKHSTHQMNFFDCNSGSTNSTRTKRTSSSRDSRDSFLNLKGGTSTSSDSIRSVNFGTTPSSGANSAGQISNLLHGMKIGHR
ncbi:RING finger protein vilya [Topomyia yanbarensis]|uniref:RING finger protein vilya n=1 Tax=Topomyia yanbarensis TaxID=2498891 RepID=UPI00273BDC20|nr:RING finger protein vilya [Topomyia yanbarensis]